MIEAAVEVESVPGDPASVLADLRDSHTGAQMLEARKMALAVHWAALHPASSIDDAAGWETQGLERARPLAGEGTPLVAEFCIADLGVALAMTSDGARVYLSDALELAHRLPRLYARVMAGEVPAWRARRVAARTQSLNVAGAGFVDRHIAPQAHTAGPAQIERTATAALSLFDPEQAERIAGVAADGRKVVIEPQPSLNGTVEVYGVVDFADGLDLDAALKAGAQAQAALGSELSLDQRRAKALGDIARRDLGLEFTDDTDSDAGTDAEDTGVQPAPAPGVKKRPTRKVVIHVHLTRSDLDGGNGPVRVRHRGTGELLTLAEQARTWCDTAASVTVVPVIDLAADITETGYEPSAHLDRLVRLRDQHCVFPYCTRLAEGCDLDHGRAYADGGPTASLNLAPLCRFHHRLKTHGSWSYVTLGPGRYRWTDPRGQTYEVDTGPRGGTIRGPDPPPSTG